MGPGESSGRALKGFSDLSSNFLFCCCLAITETCQFRFHSLALSPTSVHARYRYQATVTHPRTRVPYPPFQKSMRLGQLPSGALTVGLFSFDKVLRNELFSRMLFSHPRIFYVSWSHCAGKGRRGYWSVPSAREVLTDSSQRAISWNNALRNLSRFPLEYRGSLPSQKLHNSPSCMNFSKSPRIHEDFRIFICEFPSACVARPPQGKSWRKNIIWRKNLDAFVLNSSNFRRFSCTNIPTASHFSFNCLSAFNISDKAAVLIQIAFVGNIYEINEGD